ncbi:cytochrome c biogenesis CcdA family protein [Neopusillimonas maritima]|jgi:cytochrome c-type biogenesis protein|uniref:Cytochrome C biogenesis protein n=1 Tax=Neopusillimonas maritima TaxID=2026239 RepID=A0A3A1YNK5_9BURK|nr:cytochrome c biogenesis protein CcdA [Neopusillimonas maritima]RII82826.1 cytochrome C biogenesis protein [Neopusillimonas maritima]RIY39742.1 cytochrome C biogenesis protein [Neopusillimonas maritima]|tara:strand:+ start:203 stop:949 length:747 start_codon:yes stop_codon:yes gene_type:complete
MLELSILGLPTAFFAGIASFLSPCVLPLVPGYLSYIAGGSVAPTVSSAEARIARWRILGLSACFVLGFSLVFLVLGASITAIGRLFLSYRYELNIVAGVIIVISGLLIMGVVRAPLWTQRYYRFESKASGGNPWSAGVLGIAFGFGWTPCIGPVLGGILALGATAQTLDQGMLLLGVYALGLGIPFLLSAYFMTPFVRRLGALRRTGRYLRIVTGVIMVLMGIAVASGQMVRFAIWLLRTFPVLGNIG